MRMMIAIAASLMLAAISFADEIVLTEKSGGSPTEVTIALGDYQKFTFDITKPFKVITEPPEAKVIADTNGKVFYVLGYKDGPQVVYLYCLVDNSFHYRCIVRIDMGDSRPIPGPNQYVERLTKAYVLDNGKASDLMPLVKIYQTLVDNFDAYPNVTTLWEWLSNQYYQALPNAIPMTRSQIKTIQEDALNKYSKDKSFTVESKKVTRKCYADLLDALKEIMGKEPPKPDPKPAPKASAVWVLVVEETTTRPAWLAAMIEDKHMWDEFGGKVQFRSYDKDQRGAESYKAKLIKEKISSDSGEWTPGVIILDKATGEVLDTKKLPTTKDELKAIVKPILGK